jgi:hypothetical protein
MNKRKFEALMRRAVWVEGEGDYATVAYCGGDITIMRHETMGIAIVAKQHIDQHGCGSLCCKMHSIVEVGERKLPVVKCRVRKCSDGRTEWKFWCPFCRCEHTHGAGPGHRGAHCHDAQSPFLDGGYILEKDDEHDGHSSTSRVAPRHLHRNRRVSRSV